MCECVNIHSSIYLSIRLSACARTHVNVLTAHKSVSSFRHHDPQHALLPVSFWLASSLEEAEDSSYNALFSEKQADLCALSQRQKASVPTAAMLKRTNGIMHVHGCRDKHKTFSDEIKCVYSSLIIWPHLAVCVAKPSSRMWSHLVQQVKEKGDETLLRFERFCTDDDYRTRQ